MTFVLAAGGDSHEPILSMDAPELLNVFGIPITNSMVFTWLLGGLIILIVQLGTRDLKPVPGGLQNLIEAVVEGLHQFISGMLDPKVVRWSFPFLATFFIFILSSNLMGLLPLVGSFGWGIPAEGSSIPFALEKVKTALIRPPTSDANMTIAMAVIFFFANAWWAIRFNGLGGLIHHIFGVKGGLKGFMFAVMVPIFIFIGFLELISIGIRPVALSMRLYGNIYGGESVLSTMLHILPFNIPGIAALPFYFLELLVGIVQTLVFTILCIAFTATLCSHAEGHDEHGHDDHKEESKPA